MYTQTHTHTHTYTHTHTHTHTAKPRAVFVFLDSSIRLCDHADLWAHARMQCTPFGAFKFVVFSKVGAFKFVVFWCVVWCVQVCCVSCLFTFCILQPHLVPQAERERDRKRGGVGGVWGGCIDVLRVPHPSLTLSFRASPHHLPFSRVWDLVVAIARDCGVEVEERRPRWQKSVLKHQRLANLCNNVLVLTKK